MLELLRDLWLFIRHCKKYWLLPIISLLVLVGVLIVFVQTSVLAPFIYALF
jgi:hypothetical protein